jgi:hypothetical protein
MSQAHCEPLPDSGFAQSKAFAWTAAPARSPGVRGAHAGAFSAGRALGNQIKMMYLTSLEVYCAFIVRLKRDGGVMITSTQLRAARALLGIDQRALAVLSGVSLPTIQRMEASNGNVRGIVDSLTKIVEALDRAGIELIGENAPSQGRGRGVRLKTSPPP